MASLAFIFYRIQFRPGLRRGPRWGSLRRSSDPLVRWGGGYREISLPHSLSCQRLRRLTFDVFGAESRFLRRRETETELAPVNPISGSAPAHEGAACDAASIHFGLTMRRTNILVYNRVGTGLRLSGSTVLVWVGHFP